MYIINFKMKYKIINGSRCILPEMIDYTVIYKNRKSKMVRYILPEE